MKFAVTRGHPEESPCVRHKKRRRMDDCRGNSGSGKEATDAFQMGWFWFGPHGACKLYGWRWWRQEGAWWHRRIGDGRERNRRHWRRWGHLRSGWWRFVRREPEWRGCN